MTTAGTEENLNRDEAFDRVVEAHGGLLWRAASVYEADPELRRDLYQEILTAVWQALPRLENEASLRTYLARIAHNRGVSHVIRAARLRESALEDEPAAAAPGPEEQVAAAHLAARLQSAVHRLPLGWQQVVTLTLEGFAPREIADVLGLSANVVSIRLSRARQALRRALEERHERSA